MKHIKLFEEFLNESFGFELNEAFKSSKLRDIFSPGGKLDKELTKAFYASFGVQLDQIEDRDIIEMDPALAAREKRDNTMYFYYTTSKKQNPYVHDGAKFKTIDANTLLAVTDGNNNFYEYRNDYVRHAGKMQPVLRAQPYDGRNSWLEPIIGIIKNRGRAHTGLDTIEKIADIADVAYAIDLTALQAKYDSTETPVNRREARSGATALMRSNWELEKLKNQNIQRYKHILADRSIKDGVNNLVNDIVNMLTDSIKDALLKNETNERGQIVSDITDYSMYRKRKKKKSKWADRATTKDLNDMMRAVMYRYKNYIEFSNDEQDEETLNAMKEVAGEFRKLINDIKKGKIDLDYLDYLEDTSNHGSGLYKD